MFDILFNRNKGKNKKNNYIYELLHASHMPNEEKFNNILKFAKEMLENKSLNNDEHSIFDLIRILGRGIQSDYMRYVLYYDCEGGHHGVPQLEWSSVGFNHTTKFLGDNDELISFYNLKREVSYNKKLDLSRDLILPWPWNRTRLFNTITGIGKGREWGDWVQDYKNHYVELWLPIGIAWVGGGNHSITIGIIQGGEIKPEYCYDISEMYKHIICDGRYYRRTKTNWLIKDEIIGPVTNVEIAAIFEIGRLLVQNGISFSD